MIRFIVGLCIEGALGGVALRAILPGEQDWSIPQTLLIGLVAWIIVGLVVRIVLGVVAGLVLPILLLGGAALYFNRRRALPR
ncbi:MAG TPA: hypothetical protein VKX24_07670 [Acidimicrobiia bacterium]|nr:hypothetical protein [Acidimicrobiia bacterium]HZQ78418.1 hypothetical protein [Acidimicrobiia bacterium]